MSAARRPPRSSSCNNPKPARGVAMLAWVVCALAAAAPAARATAIFAVGAGGTQAGCGYATIQQAIDAERAYHGSNDLIYVARSQTYTAQALDVHDQSFTLIGGTDDCNDYASSGLTTLSGAGGIARSVLSIHGDSHVTIRNLDITQGDNNDSGIGGGINFVGTGALVISDSTLTNNRAGYGGGINFNGTAGADNVAQLWINRETRITGNTATTSGGGIRIEGNALLRIVEPQVMIGFNEAVGGYGGGLEVIGPARADLGSPGYLFAEYVGLLYQNSAQYGGGVSVNGGTGDFQHASVRLFATDPRHPVRIEANTAVHVGGGVYLKPDGGPSTSNASVCGSDYRITANSAQEGSAVYADEDYYTTWGYSGSHFVSGNSSYLCPGDPLDSLGAVACGSEECNRIDGNVAQNISGQATAGSAVLVQTVSEFDVDRIRIVDNRGAHAVRAVGGGEDESESSDITLRNCLLAGNANSSDLVIGDALTFIELHNCTLADNEIGSGVVVRSAGGLEITQSIVAQGQASTIAYTGSASNLQLDYVLSMEAASLAQGSHVIQADPSFVSPSRGDYRLLPTSPAIDVAPPLVGDDRDLDGRPHDQDIGGVPNLDGVRDLGAYERQARYCGAADTVFCSNFDYD